MTRAGERVARARAIALRNAQTQRGRAHEARPGPEPLRPAATVLIDGPSGAGKSSLARALLAQMPGAVLVRLDDIYPGWGGLRAASEQLGRCLLQARSAGLPGRWRRWDWERSRAAEWHVVPPGRPLIVEGCGALSAGGAPADALRVWLDADDQLRRERALLRDEGAFDEHWEMWDVQWRALIARRRPRRSATVILGGASPR